MWYKSNIIITIIINNNSITKVVDKRLIEAI